MHTRPPHSPKLANAIWLAAMLATSCATDAHTAALPGHDGPSCTVILDNRTDDALLLHRAHRDGWEPAMRLIGHTHSLQLAPGRYAVQLGSYGNLVPLPLPVAELGYQPPATITLTLWPWPEHEPGWCWIPPGISLRGDDLGIGQEDERPVTTPMLPGFFLAECETSNEQYVQFLNAIGKPSVDAAWLDFEGSKCRVHWHEDTSAWITDAPTLPVVTVSWQGAHAYCHWLGERTGFCHRLPTETEWEKAARGPGSRVYAYGDTFCTALANQESGRLLPTGNFAANGFGLFDMTGNAFEWTADTFRRDAYVGDRASSEADGPCRSLRGGSFVLDGIFVRNSMRMRLRPTVRADDVGFRVLRENCNASYGPVSDHQLRNSM